MKNGEKYAPNERKKERKKERNVINLLLRHSEYYTGLFSSIIIEAKKYCIVAFGKISCENIGPQNYFNFQALSFLCNSHTFEKCYLSLSTFTFYLNILTKILWFFQHRIENIVLYSCNNFVLLAFPNSLMLLFFVCFICKSRFVFCYVAHFTNFFSLNY